AGETERIDALRLHLGFFRRLRDVDGDADRDFGMERDADRVQAERLDRMIEHDLMALDGETCRGHRLGDVARRYRAVELAAFARLADDGDAELVELAADHFRL